MRVSGGTEDRIRQTGKQGSVEIALVSSLEGEIPVSGNGITTQIATSCSNTLRIPPKEAIIPHSLPDYG